MAGALPKGQAIKILVLKGWKGSLWCLGHDNAYKLTTCIFHPTPLSSVTSLHIPGSSQAGVFSGTCRCIQWNRSVSSSGNGTLEDDLFCFLSVFLAKSWQLLRVSATFDFTESGRGILSDASHKTRESVRFLYLLLHWLSSATKYWFWKTFKTTVLETLVLLCIQAYT